MPSLDYSLNNYLIPYFQFLHTDFFLLVKMKAKES